HRVEPLPEVVERFRRTTADLPAPAADVVRGELRLPKDLFRLPRAPVNELGTQLDRYGCVAITMGEDTAADPLACFDHQDVVAALVQSARGGEPRRAGADDYDVGLVR